uniref:Uncharacterized protein DDB_G0271670-like n=1 Tax=Diabrotica virgifera virgifera TaxID=50390 RepID=A0A6P7EYQ7_DIAVI
MIKSMFRINHDVDLEKYGKLRAFLKRKSEGFQAKKSSTLTPEQIRKFIDKAPDEIYLLHKVILIIGIMGACRSNELYQVNIQDVKDLQTDLLITIPKSKTKIVRKFTINSTFYNIVKKYIDLHEWPEDEKETLSHVKEQNSDNYNPENESDSTSSSSSCSTSSSSSSSSKDTSEEANTISGTDAHEDILPPAEIQNVSTTKSILASNENHTINNIADECPEDEKETLSHVKEQNVVITEFDSDYDNRASSSDNYNPENESDSTSSSSSCSTSSSSSSSSKDTSEEANSFIRISLQKRSSTGTIEKDRRGKHSPANKLTEDCLQMVRDQHLM